MDNRYLDVAPLGWDDWFTERETYAPAHALARVAAVDRQLLLLIDQTGTFRARLAGSYLYRHHTALELPCVGDWVYVEKQAAGDVGLVHAIVARRTLLRRKTAGEAAAFQMIAANVDYAFIVQSCHFDFNIKRLERYLVMVRDGDIHPSILLTKTDLVEPEVLARLLAEISATGVTAPVLCLSNVTGEGLDDLRQMLLPAKTYCFVGSSGVGKSTIINQLLGREQLRTQCVSGTGEGMHTTVRRELILLEGGALVIDNPGMREFGIMGAESGIDEIFADITRLASACRFRDCSHANEPGCAVREAARTGDLRPEHYENYLKINQESQFHQMSHVEKRKKDRDFGRFMKSAKRDFKKD